MKDVYYEPEAFGLETVAEIDYSSGSYEFDLRVVWRRASDGHLLTARDAGCSCPSPFETVGINDLEDVSLTRLRDEAHEELGGSYSYVSADDIARFLDAVRAAA